MRVHDWDKRDEEMITLVLQGDPHVGAKTFDEESFQEDVARASDKGYFWLNMGDALETATRDSVGAGVYEQSEIVDKQLEHYLELVRPLTDKGLFVGSHMGNHEFRLYKSAGFDLSKQISRSTGTKHFGDGVVHYIRVGGQNYVVYTTHGSSGARMPHTKIKVAIDLEKMVEAEIYAMAHLHTLSHHVRQYYAFDKRNRQLVRAERHFIITGSYLTHWGSYAHQKGMEPSKIGSARIRLYGDKKKIQVMA